MSTEEKHVGFRSTELKIKGMSLAQEARIIRKLEKNFRNKARIAKAESRTDSAKYFSGERSHTHHHRINVVRPAARATGLAYGFLRGVAYSKMEQVRYSDPDWMMIQRMIEKYGKEDPRVISQRFAAWRDAAPKVAKRY